MLRARSVAAYLGLFLLLACKQAEAPRARPLVIAAASDLARALEALGAAWEAKSGQKLEVSLGSSGLLARQIVEGAPFDVFASAAPRFIADTVKARACDGATVTPYARGRLVMVMAPGVTPPRDLAELAGPRFTRIAIANPEHAPYGVAAEEALARAGVLDPVRSRLVRAESVRQAFEQVETGNVEVALVARALTGDLPAARVILIDAAMHAPIAQTMVACGPGAAQARPFVAFVASPEGQAILARYGFDPPR
jgi:molybdate transport system substrate-binding protein